MDSSPEQPQKGLPEYPGSSGQASTEKPSTDSYTNTEAYRMLMRK